MNNLSFILCRVLKLSVLKSTEYNITTFMRSSKLGNLQYHGIYLREALQYVAKCSKHQSLIYFFLQNIILYEYCMSGRDHVFLYTLVMLSVNPLRCIRCYCFFGGLVVSKIHAQACLPATKTYHLHLWGAINNIRRVLRIECGTCGSKSCMSARIIR